LDEATRRAASRYTVKQGDRLPTIAIKKGFICWQTIWDFAGNAALKNRRGNAHILFPGDAVAIPSKLDRVAKVFGGEAEFVLMKAPEFLRVRFAEVETMDGEPVMFRATPDAGSDCFEGELAADGTMEIELPPETTKVTVELFCGEGDDPFVTYQLNVGEMDPLTEDTGIQARLANLGYYDGKIDGDIGDVTKSAIVRFRREYGLPLSDEVDDDLRNALQWVHDDDDDTDDCESDQTTPDDFKTSVNTVRGSQGESEGDGGADDDSADEDSVDFDDEDPVDWEDDEGDGDEGDEDDDSGEVTS